MLCVRLKIRRAFGDDGEHFIFRYCVRRRRGSQIPVYEGIMDTAAMREDLRNGYFLGVRNLREEFVERVGQL